MENLLVHYNSIFVSKRTLFALYYLNVHEFYERATVLTPTISLNRSRCLNITRKYLVVPTSLVNPAASFTCFSRPVFPDTISSFLSPNLDCIEWKVSPALAIFTHSFYAPNFFLLLHFHQIPLIDFATRLLYYCLNQFLFLIRKNTPRSLGDKFLIFSVEQCLLP